MNMKVEHINPFIEATVDAMQMMTGVEVAKKDLGLKEEPGATFDVSGVIGLGGEASGSIVLSFPRGVALKIASKFVGEELVVMDEKVYDAIGELVNIVAGCAKGKLADDGGKAYTISLPNVVAGRGHRVFRPADVPCIAITFGSKFGDFAVEISLKSNGR